MHIDINGLVAEFESELVEEYSAVPIVTKLGLHKNRMEMKVSGSGAIIIWNYGKKAADEDETLIGLQFDSVGGKRVLDYDGVFSLPYPARKLLISNGYDLTEIGYDSDGNEIEEAD